MPSSSLVIDLRTDGLAEQADSRTPVLSAGEGSNTDLSPRSERIHGQRSFHESDGLATGLILQRNELFEVAKPYGRGVETIVLQVSILDLGFVACKVILGGVLPVFEHLARK